ncbi:MAG: hypothetical protein SFY80_03710 [Verrucomicrobiota bacterium]|nr:hypothetical protein [Verrucomicrobiota bacterium]
MNHWIIFGAFVLSALLTNRASADVACKIDSITTAGNKAMVTVKIRNNFEQSIKDARIWVFLVDAEGKVAGNKAEWIIGGKPDQQNSLAAKAENDYPVVITTKQPFTHAKIVFSKIIMENGSSPDIDKEVRELE